LNVYTVTYNTVTYKGTINIFYVQEKLTSWVY